VCTRVGHCSHGCHCIWCAQAQRPVRYRSCSWPRGQREGVMFKRELYDKFLEKVFAGSVKLFSFKHFHVDLEMFRKGSRAKMHPHLVHLGPMLSPLWYLSGIQPTQAQTRNLQLVWVQMTERTLTKQPHLRDCEPGITAMSPLNPPILRRGHYWFQDLAGLRRKIV
jgi:hypothetical protein